MTAVIQIEKLTKTYGTHRGIVDIDLEVGGRRGVRVPRARTGPARRRRSGRCSITSGPTSGRARVFGIETTVDPVAIHRRLGYLPGEFALYDKLTGGQTLEYFANLRGGVDRLYQQDLIARLDVDPIAAVPRVLQGQQAEDRADHRPPAPAGPAAPGRADLRPGPADPAGRSTRSSARRRPRAGRSSCRRTSCPRSRGRATGWRSSAMAAWPGSTGRGASRPRASPGRARVHRPGAGRGVRGRCPA